MFAIKTSILYSGAMPEPGANPLGPTVYRSLEKGHVLLVTHKSVFFLQAGVDQIPGCARIRPSFPHSIR